MDSIKSDPHGPRPIDLGYRGLRPEHYTGAVSEYLAAAHFLKKGHQVYWPAVQQGPVDFVVDLGGTLKRVQVKTATWIEAGGYRYLQCRTRVTNKRQSASPADLYDILVVVHDASLWVIPAEEITSSNIGLDGTNPNYKRPKWDQYRH